ncbi:tyrosine-protein kinase HTK16-like isoform X2 [Daphnia pulex]|uniref:tyrosine-protein kinase HTK16-like isoform X2 n=1 Tax=Daphnia pulex TaxID=6669 RepID=UPI001EDD9933|nr:tyrosine-protein kinase HTK16-like isoform X2 [Daphnia pulex]
MSKEVLETESCYEMDFTQRCGDKVDVSKDQKVSIMVKKVKVPVGGENKALNCTHCKVTCQYPGNSNISTAESSSCPAFEMEDMGAAALDSDFVSVSWACKVCPGHCLGGVHKYEDFKWYFTQETTNSMEDQHLDEEEITKNWKKKIEKEIETLRLDVLEMKALANNPPTTRPENIQEMITPEEDINKKPAGEDEKIVKGLFETTIENGENGKSTEQIPEIKPLEFKLELGNMMCSGYYRAFFGGSFNGEKVAIKRVRADRTKFHENEEKILNKFNHPNVIKLLQMTQDANYRFYVFELSAGTIDDFCSRDYKGKMPSDDEALKQMAAGLLYIHGKRYAHSNISPYSVLISSSEPVRLMIAKFVSCEPTTNTGTFSIEYFMGGSAEVWMAPELYDYYDYYDGYTDQQPVNSFSIACDTWSLGCLFFYFLTRGVHPYGDDDETIPWKVLMKQKPVKLEALQASNHELSPVYELIRDMIDPQPEKRISLESVVKRLENVLPPSATA